MNYTLRYADGREETICADQDADAEFIAAERFGEDAVVADQWDVDGHDADGTPCERLLIWTCEADSINGANAVATLTVVRSQP